MAKSAAIVVIGDEFLSGVTQGTGSCCITKKLAELGVEVRYKSGVPNDSLILEQELRRLTEEYDMVITLGGLGTAPYGIARKAIARFLGRKLVLRNRIVEDIRSYFANRGEEMPLLCYSQALLPQGTTPIRNPKGVTPGFVIENSRKWLVALPDMRSELEAILEGAIALLPKGLDNLVECTIRTTGMAKSEIQEALGGVLKGTAGEITFLPIVGGVDIRLTVRGNETRALEQLKVLEGKTLNRIGKYVYGRNKETLEEIIGQLLTQRKLFLSVAESCTGGLVKHRITNVPGSSKYFLGGVVAYHNDVKEKLLGVPKEILVDHGAVSKETAIHMAGGVRELVGSDIGIGITGIAGPAGDTSAKSIGLVYLALSTPDCTRWEEHRFAGGRSDIKEQSAQASLDMLRRFLSER